MPISEKANEIDTINGILIADSCDRDQQPMSFKIYSDREIDYRVYNQILDPSYTNLVGKNVVAKGVIKEAKGIKFFKIQELKKVTNENQHKVNIGIVAL